MPEASRSRLGPGDGIREVLFRAVLLTMSVLFVLVPLELWLTAKHARELAERAEGESRFHPFLQALPRAGDSTLHINALGFRGEEVSADKPEGTVRIFVLGGSTALSAEVDYEASHARLLEHRLRMVFPDDSTRIEVLNGGMHWFTTEHTLIRYLFDVADLEPDLVIAFHAVNDLYRSFSPTRFSSGPYRSDYRHFFGPASRMVNGYFRDPQPARSHIVREVQAQLRARAEVSPSEGVPEVDMGIEEFKSLSAIERNLDRLARVLADDGVDLILATQPYLYRDDLTGKELERVQLAPAFFHDERGRASVSSVRAAMEAANTVTARVAARRGVPLVDLEAVVPKSLDYFLDDVHYTEQGNRLVADAFAEELLETGWITARLAGEPR